LNALTIEKFQRWLGWFNLALLGFSVVVSFAGVTLAPAFWFFLIGLLLFTFVFLVVRQRMVVYVAKRLFEAALTLLVIATVTFLLLRTIPGGPFDSDKVLPPQVKANIEAKYNLNEPLYVQYFIYLGDLLKGDLGESYKYLGRSVTDMVVETLPPSFELGAYSLILAYLIGIPLGVIAASRHNSWMDNAAMFVSISGVSLPAFLVAPILILIFSFGLNWLPPAFWDGPAYYILPVITLGIRPAGVIARLVRASVLEVIRSDYIRTAKAKGLTEGKILFKHVLRNSLVSMVSYSGPLIAAVLSGAFVIEVIFAIPGMGRHLVQSVTNRDYPLILGTTLVFAVMLVICNLIADLVNSALDPRIKLQ
jgi:oligopeptide transport system permease protein